MNNPTYEDKVFNTLVNAILNLSYIVEGLAAMTNQPQAVKALNDWGRIMNHNLDTLEKERNKCQTEQNLLSTNQTVS